MAKIHFHILFSFFLHLFDEGIDGGIGFGGHERGRRHDRYGESRLSFVVVVKGDTLPAESNREPSEPGLSDEILDAGEVQVMFWLELLLEFIVLRLDVGVVSKSRWCWCPPLTFFTFSSFTASFASLSRNIVCPFRRRQRPKDSLLCS